MGRWGTRGLAGGAAAALPSVWACGNTCAVVALPQLIPAHRPIPAAQPGPVPWSQSIVWPAVPIKDVGLIMTQRQTDVL
jgi:hypothetical protein